MPLIILLFYASQSYDENSLRSKGEKQRYVKKNSRNSSNVNLSVEGSYNNKRILFTFPTAKIVKKSSMEECIFNYMALHIECLFTEKLTPQVLHFSVCRLGCFMITLTLKCKKFANVKVSYFQSKPRLPALISFQFKTVVVSLSDMRRGIFMSSMLHCNWRNKEAR